MAYELLFSAPSIRDLRKMPAPIAARIRGELDKLTANPSRRDIDVAPLRDRPGFRLRVGGYRAIFNRDDDARTIRVLRIAPRGSVYR